MVACPASGSNTEMPATFSVASSFTVRGEGAVICGALFTPVTVSMNVAEAARPPRSVAVTLMLIAPTSALLGVPLKSSVSPSKCNHEGSGSPSANVAEYVSLSPLSTSLKVPAGTV